MLESALAELPPHYRAVILLRDIEGMSTTDVADSRGISIGTVKTRAHRARLQLGHRLSSFIASASAGDGKPREPNQRHPHRKADVLAIA